MTAPIVLVADDCRTLRVIVRRYLDALGFQTIVVANAIDAYQEALIRRFDLIILDLQMPDKDGQDLILEIARDCELNSQTPHLFITAEGPASLSSRGLNKDFLIQKPIEEQVFCSRVRRALNQETEHYPC